MSKATLADVAREARDFSLEPEWTPEMNERLMHELEDAGFIVHAPTEVPARNQFHAYQPIIVQGKAVSETLLEERR